MDQTDLHQVPIRKALFICFSSSFNKQERSILFYETRLLRFSTASIVFFPRPSTSLLMRVPVHIMGGRVRHITNCLYRSSRHSIVRCAWKCSWGDQDMIAKGRRRRLQHLIGQKAMWRKICFCLSRTSDQAMPPTLPCLHCDRSIVRWWTCFSNREM